MKDTSHLVTDFLATHRNDHAVFHSILSAPRETHCGYPFGAIRDVYRALTRHDECAHECVFQRNEFVLRRKIPTHHRRDARIPYARLCHHLGIRKRWDIPMNVNGAARASRCTVFYEHPHSLAFFDNSICPAHVRDIFHSLTHQCGIREKF